ncbi:TPA: hypothetical protein U1C81_000562 [Streptococcus suis]|nr:hypothetical protein [Streptococcus suis]HEM3666830.1 hypothetical protein [Streptococcus suis]HEM3720806.1 hypothetical protein [Streptococcus suis]
MFEICDRDLEYCESVYRQIYRSFLFSMKIYGSHLIYRKKLLNDTIDRIDNLFEKHVRVGLVSGRLNLKYKELVYEAYIQITGERMVKRK